MQLFEHDAFEEAQERFKKVLEASPYTHRIGVVDDLMDERRQRLETEIGSQRIEITEDLLDNPVEVP